MKWMAANYYGRIGTKLENTGKYNSNMLFIKEMLLTEVQGIY